MAKAKEKVKSYQEQLNDVDAKITELQAKKKELANLALKEAKEVVEMPLHQLNAIGQIGYKAAKERYGKKWVEQLMKMPLRRSKYTNQMAYVVWKQQQKKKASVNNNTLLVMPDSVMIFNDGSAIAFGS